MKGTVLSITERVAHLAVGTDRQFHCGVRQRPEDPSKQLVYGEEPALVKLGRLRAASHNDYRKFLRSHILLI